ITDFIELKISQMSESVDIEEDKFKELESIIKNIESYVANIKRILTTEQDEVHKMVSNQDTLVKGAIALEIKGNSIIKTNIKEIEEKQKILKNILMKNEEINKEIEVLSLSKSGV